VEPRFPEDLVAYALPIPARNVWSWRRLRTSRRVARARSANSASVHGNSPASGPRASKPCTKLRALAIFEDVHLSHAFVVAIAKIFPVIEDKRQRGGTREFRLGVVELEDAGEHRVHHDRALVQVENQELASMSHAGEAAMRERRVDGTRRAQDGWISDANEDDLASDERLLEATAHDVKVGPFRHCRPTSRG